MAPTLTGDPRVRESIRMRQRITVWLISLDLAPLQTPDVAFLIGWGGSPSLLLELTCENPRLRLPGPLLDRALMAVRSIEL